MKKLITSLVILALVGLFVANINSPALASVRHYFYFSPCNTPISYKIGTIDPRFGVSKDQFSSDITEAGQIWDKVEEKALFKSDSQGTLTINLIYDQRQALRNQTTQLENQLNQEQNSLNPQIQSYQAESADFKNKLAALNAEIEKWNAQGGAPSDVYDQLIKEQNDLKIEADKLNAEAKQLNLTAQNYNTQVGQLNKTVDNFNALLQVKPEEGLYTPAENRIDIYFDNSQPELIHTLAHEMGHALGLDHNQNPKSIMYPSSTEYTVPSVDDKTALDNICRERSVVELGQNYLQNYLQRVQTVLGNLQR